jgi:hypothetical protein
MLAVTVMFVNVGISTNVKQEFVRLFRRLGTLRLGREGEAGLPALH